MMLSYSLNSTVLEINDTWIHNSFLFFIFWCYYCWCFSFQSAVLAIFCLFLLFSVLFLKGPKDLSTGLAARIAAWMDDNAVNLSNTLHIHFISLYAWCEDPDVVECKNWEVASPVASNPDTINSCSNDVAEFQPKVEALVAKFPYTVQGVDCIRLSKNFLKSYPQVVIQVVGITVFQICLTVHDDLGLVSP